MHPLHIDETAAEKAARRLAGWACWAIVVVLVIAVSGALAGCATDRYLTVEQDAELRQACEQHGCDVIPSPIWRQIEQVLRLLRGQGT